MGYLLQARPYAAQTGTVWSCTQENPNEKRKQEQSLNFEDNKVLQTFKHIIKSQQPQT